ncbi:Pycsar system effector family protein [Novosphingobium gossypii]|uniref:Pycsar system effector family protein n=1 Tax=Novosphingobium gossypii TaxID=1604774 RepID=UPI003D1A433B
MDDPNLISLEVYERQLDRTLNFFPRIDSKVTALLAVVAAQIAIAAVNTKWGDLRVGTLAIPLALFLLSAAYVYVQLYRCTYPHLTGGQRSLVYFNEIAQLREADFVSQYSKLTEDDLKFDIGGQIWRNAEILKCKYGFLKTATIGTLIGTIPWAFFLMWGSILHGELIKLSSG